MLPCGRPFRCGHRLLFLPLREMKYCLGQEALHHMAHVRATNEGVELVDQEPVLHGVIGSR